MIPLVRAELVKLATTRAPRALVIGTVVFVALAALRATADAGRRGAASIGTTGAALDLLDGYRVASVVAAVLGALVATGELRHGTLTSYLLRSPRRSHVVLAKGAAVSVLATATGLAGLVVVLAVGLGSGSLTSGVAIPDVGLPAAGLLLSYPAYGLLGLGLGLLLPRYQALVAVLPAVWLLLLEDLVLGSFTRPIPPWALSRVSASAASALDVHPLLPAWAGALALVGYALALCGAGAVRTHRLDIT